MLFPVCSSVSAEFPFQFRYCPRTIDGNRHQGGTAVRRVNDRLAPRGFGEGAVAVLDLFRGHRLHLRAEAPGAGRVRVAAAGLAKSEATQEPQGVQRFPWIEPLANAVGAGATLFRANLAQIARLSSRYRGFAAPGDGARSLSRIDVGQREVVALEQKPDAVGFGAGVGEAVAEIELRRMPPFSKSLETIDCQPPDAFVYGNLGDAALKASQTYLKFQRRPAAARSCVG